MQPRQLIKDSTVFNEAFLPRRFINRDSEISVLRNALTPLIERKPARNIWMHGPPGGGKTSVAKLILNEFEDRHGIRGAYTNCWESDTFYLVLDKLVRDFRILGAERLVKLHKMERLEKWLQGRPFLLVLDEIDKPSSRERDAIIYNLCGMPGVVLICICNSRYFFYTMDSRARSRLNPLLLEFQPYTPKQLLEILRQRAEVGLQSDSPAGWVLKRIARMAKGDARVAIQTLGTAAVRAEKLGGKRVQLGHLRPGHEAARHTRRKYLLAKLDEHDQIICRIIEQGEIDSASLRKDYVKRCRRKRLQPMARRTFSKHLRQLSTLGLICQRRAFGFKGNVRIFSAAT